MSVVKRLRSGSMTTSVAFGDGRGGFEDLEAGAGTPVTPGDGAHDDEPGTSHESSISRRRLLGLVAGALGCNLLSAVFNEAAFKG